MKRIMEPTMLMLAALASLSIAQEAPSAIVPDVHVTGPRPDSVWCLRNNRRTGSRVRRTECRTHAEWVAVVEVRQDQAANLYRQDGRYLIDSEILEAVADAAARDVARRHAREAARDPAS